MIRKSTIWLCLAALVASNRLFAADPDWATTVKYLKDTMPQYGLVDQKLLVLVNDDVNLVASECDKLASQPLFINLGFANTAAYLRSLKNVLCILSWETNPVAWNIWNLQIYPLGSIGEIDFQEKGGFVYIKAKNGANSFINLSIGQYLNQEYRVSVNMFAISDKDAATRLSKAIFHLQDLARVQASNASDNDPFK